MTGTAKPLGAFDSMFNRLLPWLSALAVAAFVISPAVTADFNGFPPEIFPIPQINPPVQPAGYAFSIWGLIYIWLCAHIGYGLWSRRDARTWVKPRVGLLLALGLGAFWLALANSAPIAATVLIFWMLFWSLYAFLKAPAQKDRWFLQAPIGVLAGWLSAASFVSLGLVLAGFGVVSQVPAALLALGGLVLLGLIVQTRKPTAVEYGATLIWALIGVLVANLGGNWAVQVATAAAILAVTLVGVRGVWGRQHSA